MGGCCCCSCKFLTFDGFRVNDDVEGQDSESFTDMKRLGLTKQQINAFYRAFKKIDKKNLNIFKISDLLNYMKINATPITLRAFGELDLSTDGMLNFREFVLSAWKFCARRREGISDMAFSMYDKNNSGDLTTNEISTMVRECYGKISDTHNVWEVLKKFDSDGDSKVSREEFTVTCSKHPALLAPAINFQKHLKDMISTSNTFWNSIYVTSNRTMHSKHVKVMFRTPDKIESVRAEMERANVTNHVKGYSYDNNMGSLSKPSARKGKDKWNVDTSSFAPKKKKKVFVANCDYGLFD